MITVYGIPNCDTVKKARTWLAAQRMVYIFHDFKKRGVPEDKLLEWASSIGWDKLVNRNGTTWRKLDAAHQASFCSVDGNHALVMANPGLIKRPVVQWGTAALSALTVGFDAAAWAVNAQSAQSAQNAANFTH